MVLDPNSFERLCRARDLLQGEQRGSIREVARTAGMSAFHFIRQFEALFGVTPHQFRIRARLDRARQLLETSEHSVTDICLQVGMSSLGSFSDLFARRVGSAPSDYRSEARGQGPAPGCLNLMGLLPPSAFRNFQEAPADSVPLECGHADQAHQCDGR